MQAIFTNIIRQIKWDYLSVQYMYIGKTLCFYINLVLSCSAVLQSLPVLTKVHHFKSTDRFTNHPSVSDSIQPSRTNNPSRHAGSPRTSRLLLSEFDLSALLLERCDRSVSMLDRGSPVLINGASQMYRDD